MNLLDLGNFRVLSLFHMFLFPGYVIKLGKIMTTVSSNISECLVKNGKMMRQNALELLIL